MNSNPPVAVVTGGSRGIGAAIVKRLAAGGHNILLNYRANHDAARALAAQIGGLQRIELLCADVGTRDGAAQLGACVDEAFGRIDVLVNNAGAIMAPSGWEEMTEASFRATLDVNLGATMYCIQELADRMRLAPQPSIINLSSTYALSGAGPVAAYTAAKAGVIAVTRGLARDLAPEIRVNAIVPGNIDTEMSRSAGDEVLTQVVAQTPMGRLGRTEEVADLAVFLASQSASFITGQAVIIDGGFSL